ncbi:hypothetical protein [Alloactinosynnema sp. L-07]|nr:hypothetical protein [Alloactinosynnema sp. L-07]
MPRVANFRLKQGSYAHLRARWLCSPRMPSGVKDPAEL